MKQVAMSYTMKVSIADAFTNVVAQKSAGVIINTSTRLAYYWVHCLLAFHLPQTF